MLHRGKRFEPCCAIEHRATIAATTTRCSFRLVGLKGREGLGIVLAVRCPNNGTYRAVIRGCSKLKLFLEPCTTT